MRGSEKLEDGKLRDVAARGRAAMRSRKEGDRRKETETGEKGRRAPLEIKQWKMSSCR